MVMVGDFQLQTYDVELLPFQTSCYTTFHKIYSRAVASHITVVSSRNGQTFCERKYATASQVFPQSNVMQLLIQPHG